MVGYNPLYHFTAFSPVVLLPSASQSSLQSLSLGEGWECSPGMKRPVCMAVTKLPPSPTYLIRSKTFEEFQRWFRTYLKTYLLIRKNQ